MGRSVFIDFDGTFADYGRIPTEHLEAVRAARAAGHRVFLCTGRPKVMVPRGVREGLFDGLVCAAGGYVEIGGQVLADVRFPAEVAARTATVLRDSDATFLLESPNRLYSVPGAIERIGAVFARLMLPEDSAIGTSELTDILDTSTDLTQCSFSKASIVNSPIPVSELTSAIGPAVGALPNSITGLDGHAGEIYQLGVDKASGIRVVEAHLGLRRADIIAIGDGHNDIEMLEYAGTGVAVEESPEVVKAVAQLVVSGPQRAGVAQAFTELGLISPVAAG